MSFLRYKSCVQFGDIVTIYLSFKSVFVQKIEKGKVFQTKYGAIKHDDLVGKAFGTKIHCKKGWVYLIHITPELWTLTLPHRTQILYATDISLITSLLNLKPGSIVIEAGTGSGSLSHSILRTIAPNGHLFTFDFHEERVKIAKEEFHDHGLSELVSIAQRDVCKDGFGLTNIADAVFLDLPHPWKAIEFASLSLKTKGTFLMKLLQIMFLLRLGGKTVVGSCKLSAILNN
ncbi:tRNA (adenine-N(1)-)-methyltransferase-like protein [Dinothrombium tinctorium]|uniref:tRNA (adenine(58)-N(1))-methyltransferase n=1 Tax=Dinothrombium tinctorium TaxID=1965070 RepID=A0A3S3P3D7_9ACAR|nr:tRNA (adenine-N(1)-)-methyltransferase-like protein [Dinothrombium tinctorium]